MQEAINQYLIRNGFQHFKPKAVLFDMDGVLIDSMANHAVAWQQAMKKFSITMTEADAYATEGQRGIDTIRIMVKEQKNRDISEAEAQLMYDEKTRLFHKMRKARVFPGVRCLLKKIQRKGMKIVVVTGSGQRPLISRLLDEFGEFLTEDRIVTAYDVTRGKPSPDPYLTGLQRAGNLKPWEAVVIENAPLGVKAGVAANILTIAINTGPLSDHLLSHAGADIVFHQISEVTKNWNQLFKERRNVNYQKWSYQENKWMKRYQEIINYMQTYKRRPSKHRKEDHAMLNWIKYNRKRKAKGLLAERYMKAFDNLQSIAEQYQKVNQYQYRSKDNGTYSELNLFETPKA